MGGTGATAATGPVALIGSGLIGSAWAVVFARGGLPVRILDREGRAAANALPRIDRSLAQLAEGGLLDEPVDAIRARIALVPTLEAALDGAVLAQESVPEDLALKRATFALLDGAAAPETILASSTSMIPASRFTEDLPGRSRCLVAHPVNPPHLVPVVELVVAPWTEDAVTERARGLYAAAGQAPVVLRREVDGFLVNRLQGALLAEALRLYEDGLVTAADVDVAIRDGLGLRWSFMGPFETIDLNAPGGTRDYGERYAGVYEAVTATQLPRPWRQATFEALDAERRALVPLDRLGERRAWRDERLVALAAHKRARAQLDAQAAAADAAGEDGDARDSGARGPATR